MVARVTHYQIRAGKIEEFVATVESLTAAMDKLTGFRSLSSCAVRIPRAGRQWRFPFGSPRPTCGIATAIPTTIMWFRN
jgi:hypothetical protein